MSDNRQRYQYLFANIAAFLCGNLGTKLISFFLVPLYTNVLLPAEYGEIDLILSIAGVISPFIGCGIHEGVMRFSLDKGSNHKLIFSIGMRVFLISSVLFLAATPLLRWIPLISEHIFFLYLYCILNELMTILLCYIRGKDKTKLYAFLGFLSALFMALLNILFLVGFKWGLFGYKISMLLTPVLTSLVTVVCGKVFLDFSIRVWEKKVAKDMLQYSFILIPNSILWWCINASDRFFVSYICGAADNGIYAVAYKIPTLLNMVSSIFMQAWQLSAIKEHENKDDSCFSEVVYKYLIFFMGAATICLMLVNRPVLSMYVSEEYVEAWKYSPILMLTFFAGSLSAFWGSFYIASKNMKGYLYSAFSGAFVNIVLNFVLIKSVGAIGAAIATATSYIIVFLVRAYGICKTVQIKVVNYQLVVTIGCLLIGLFSAYMSGISAWCVGLMNIAVYILMSRRTVVGILKLIFKSFKRY